jgi:excisionase family DNA binding protein
MANTSSTLPVGRFLSVDDVAEELRVSSKHVRRMIARGELPIYRFGKIIRIARDDLDRCINGHRQ